MCSEMTSGRKSYRVRQNSGLWVALVAWTGIILGLGTAQAPAQCVEQQTLIASEPAANGQFASRVSVSGDVTVVGAQRDDCAAGERCGAAYVFRYNGTSWVEEQKLTASDAAADDRFGSTVSVSGDVTVVGAQGDDCAAGVGCGSAYVFRFNGSSWVEEQKLTASDAGAYDHLGGGVSVSGDVAVLGAAGNPCDGGSFCGSAYVFRFNGSIWVEEQMLTASDALNGRFGRSVSVSGDTAVVGAYFDDCAAGSFCGSAYVFRFNGTSWVEEQKLTASDARAGDLFGGSVSVSGDTAVIGADGDDCAASSICGAAYVFRFNGSSWVEQPRLTAPDARAEDLFGVSVSVSRDTVVVGAPGRDCAAGGRCGAAYVFSCLSAPAVANLDIKPGSCPNRVNPKARGLVPVALVGSLDFDVATVDAGSLTLARADGVGGTVSPLSHGRGSGIVIEDMATPFGDEPCGCHEWDGDGIDDLSLKFSTAEMARAFELNQLPRRATIELVLRGTSYDGSAFEAVDCVTTPG